MALVAGALLPASAYAQKTLRILAWPGYVDEVLIKNFEQKYGAKVELNVAANDYEVRQRVSADRGANYDVTVVNSAELSYFLSNELLVPLRKANLPNRNNQQPQYHNPLNIPDMLVSGELYAVPYSYSEMGLIFDRRQYRAPPLSIADLWDPRHKGRVLAMDSGVHNFTLASLDSGGDAFRIDRNDFAKMVERLVALRRNVLTFYRLPEEAVDIFKNYQVALLYASNARQLLRLMKDAGLDVGYVVPKEGALAWLDCWAVVRGVKDRALAEKWINYTLDSQVSSETSRRLGRTNTIDSPTTVDSEVRTLWLENVEDEDRRNDLWRRIMSGDLPERF